MKGITPIIGVIILVLIVVALGGTAYIFISGDVESYISSTIIVSPVPGEINTFSLQNAGRSVLNPGELTVTVEGQKALIINPQSVDPGQDVFFVINSP